MTELGLRNLKICKILIIFDFFFYIFHIKPNMRKSFFLVLFFSTNFCDPDGVLLRKQNIEENREEKWKEIKFIGK